MSGDRADRSQMVQVIMNLCINAAESIDGEGHITLEAHNVELPGTPPVEAPELPPGRYLVLTVRDSGRGMDAKTKARLFEPSGMRVCAQPFLAGELARSIRDLLDAEGEVSE